MDNALWWFSIHVLFVIVIYVFKPIVYARVYFQEVIKLNVLLSSNQTWFKYNHRMHNTIPRHLNWRAYRMHTISDHDSDLENVSILYFA